MQQESLGVGFRHGIRDGALSLGLDPGMTACCQAQWDGERTHQRAVAAPGLSPLQGWGPANTPLLVGGALDTVVVSVISSIEVGGLSDWLGVRCLREAEWSTKLRWVGG